MNRRKGVPCGCDADPCGCSPKNHCVKAINNVSPDPNGDLTIKAGSGIAINQTGDNKITIVNTSDPDTFIEGKNIEFTPSGDDLEINVVDDPVIDGTLTVNGDIIQNGAAYETHAEKVYTTNDYIVMRDGAVGGLAVGDYSGFQVEKYDGTNDGRLVIDRDGVARVGDVNDEQPLMTRDESADMTNGALIKWDAAQSKAVNEGNVGSDSKPIKIVNGVATEVTNVLQPKIAVGRCRNIQNNVPANSVTPIVFSENYTTDNDTISVSNGVFTVKKPGIYHIFMSISGSITASSRVELSLKRDGSSEYGYLIREITTTGTNQSVSADIVINETTANHTFQMEVWSQSSAMSTSNAGTYGSTFNMIYLG